LLIGIWRNRLVTRMPSPSLLGKEKRVSSGNYRFVLFIIYLIGAFWFTIKILLGFPCNSDYVRKVNNIVGIILLIYVVSNCDSSLMHFLSPRIGFINAQ
jgi:hypothetical protein